MYQGQGYMRLSVPRIHPASQLISCQYSSNWR
jgi:hypothetical protein